MASIKIVLRKEKKQDGTFPLAIRITQNRKTSYIYLNYSIHTNDWNPIAQEVRKSHPNYKRLNTFLAKKLATAKESSLEIETKNPTVSVKALRQELKPAIAATFSAQANDYLAKLKNSGKYNQYTADKPRIGHFNDFLNNESYTLSDITPGLLERFVAYLKSYHLVEKNKTGDKTKKLVKPGKPMGERTIVNHLVTIRSVYAHARKNKASTKEQSPFGGDDGIKIKFPETNKVGISPEEVTQLEELILEDPRHDHARRLWLFSFYFAGMRVSDMLRLRWSDFQNYRLHYSMGKNDKSGSLKIPDQAIKILKYYEQFKRNKDDLIFPELKNTDLTDDFNTQKTIAFKTSALDKILRKHVAPAAGIEHKLTMHIARHTFGSMAGDAIPIQMLQKLYRHSNVSTTIGYQSNFIHKDADDALDVVINRKSKNTPR